MKNADPEFSEYYKRKDALSTIDGCLMWHNRLIIPKQFRSRILKQLHKAHPEMERMKSIARSHVYWPHIDHDIEQYVRNCNRCAEAAKTPPRVPLAPWPMPPIPWHRIHIDFADPVHNTYYSLS